MRAAERARPNILWFMSEDCPPKGAAYGDPLADTPTIDALAARGVLFENAFCLVPVCAPSRFALISGMHPQSVGPAEHMEQCAHLPEGAQTYPEALRAVGYYCTNNSKTHYNSDIVADDIWDESSATAHWRDRPGDAPFLAVFNPTHTHESAVFSEELTTVTPEEVCVPAYLPDTPEVRKDIARYYTAIKRMDDEFALRVAELEEDGLLGDTIIVYSSDHGGVTPRSKRFCYDEGLRVPLIVSVPERWAHLSPWGPGTRVREAVSQIDLAPTLVALGGAAVPENMQGRALFGAEASAPAGLAFSGRNRMDERYDMMRTIRDERYRYIRNYTPHRIYGQHYAYAWEAEGYRSWEREHLAGALNPVQDAFWRTKPAEELYDTVADPDEVDNLAGSEEHRERLERLRRQLDAVMVRINDNGFIPEGSDLAGYHESRVPGAYPLERVMRVASRAISRDPGNLERFVSGLDDPDKVIRYWSLQGILMLLHAGRERVPVARGVLQRALADASGPIRVAAAECLALLGEEEAAVRVLADTLDTAADPWLRLQALNALTAIGDAARPALDPVRRAAEEENEYVRGAARYLQLVLEHRYDPGARIFDHERMRLRITSMR